MYSKTTRNKVSSHSFPLSLSLGVSTCLICTKTCAPASVPLQDLCFDVIFCGFNMFLCPDYFH